jgi:hypothetical protein
VLQGKMAEDEHVYEEAMRQRQFRREQKVVAKKRVARRAQKHGAKARKALQSAYEEHDGVCLAVGGRVIHADAAQ